MQPITKDIFGNIVDPTKVYQLPKQQKGKGGFLSSLISEAGGATGAAGGAAIGSLFGGVGAIPGAIIGGFLGGTGGKAAEQKYRDNQNFFGAGGSAKSAFGEGALSGALSGAGEAFQLAKLGKAATETRGITNFGKNIIAGGEQRAASIAEKQALKDLGQNATKESGRLSNIGSSFRAQPRGIVAGVDQGGGRVLTAAEAKAQNAAIDEATKGATGLTKTGQFTAIDKRINSLAKTYKLTPEAKSIIGEEDILKLMQGVEDNVTANTSLRGNLTKSAQTTLNNIYDDFGKMTGKTRGDLVDYAAQVNKKAAGIVNKGQVGSKEVQIWEEVRNATKDFIDNSPSFADKSGVNKKLSTLLGARSSLTKAVTADVNAGMRSGFTGGRAISDIASPLLDVSGRGLQAVGKVTGSQLGRNFVRQSPASLTRAIGGGMQPQDQTQIDQSQGQNIYGQTGGQDTTGMGGISDLGGTQQPQQAPQSAYSLEQAMRDLNSTNNPKFQQQIMDRYDFVQKAEAAQKPASTVGKTSAATLALAQQGMNALGQLDQLIQSDPGVLQRTRTPGRGLPIIGGDITKASGTGRFDTLAFAAVSSLLRAQSGAAVPDSEVRAYMRNYLPRAGEDQATVQQKLQTLAYDFQSVLQGGNQSNLSSAIGGQ